MGKYSKGLLGEFTGKVGSVIGSRWKGIYYMRSKSNPSSVPPSESQMQQRARFARTSKFLQPLHPILRVGYSTQIKRKSPINSAMADAMLYAIGRDFPVFTIDYARFTIAKGTLSGPQGASVTLEANMLNFTWLDNTSEAFAKADDQVLMVALGEGVYPSWSIGNVRRSDASGSLPVPHRESGGEYHCYLAFVSADLKQVSNSLYLGGFTLPAPDLTNNN